MKMWCSWLVNMLIMMIVNSMFSEVLSLMISGILVVSRNVVVVILLFSIRNLVVCEIVCSCVVIMNSVISIIVNVVGIVLMVMFGFRLIIGWVIVNVVRVSLVVISSELVVLINGVVFCCVVVLVFIVWVSS